jgi:hypothetical protein
MRGADRAFRGIAATAAAGAVGGIYGAAAMTVLRLAAQRAGLIDKMVPQVIEEALIGRPHHQENDEGAHEVLNQLLHLGYGAAWGAAAGPLLAGRKRPGLWAGSVLGLGLWGIGLALLLPRHRAFTPGGWQASLGAQLVNATAHLLFGTAVQLTTQEPVSGQLAPRAGITRTAHPRIG